eukprot:TRINITY_DN11390_c0_g1_i1.p1 TRINITY_DN11390_c0_g1~~TRINITY_DN11390_c0_g1_i1.p1  ORF type:complete len:697 (-),score=291.55 TRINITY_DN11390_c0_g1_i1:33-2066(-)
MADGANEEIKQALASLARGIPLEPLPERPAGLDASVPHAPKRTGSLSVKEKKLAIANALRYFPSHLHAVLAPEFVQELETYNHIYMYRFRPTHYEMKAYPIDYYPAKCHQAAAIMLMIMNNLDRRVAQFPHELVTYGGNGCVFQNWGQFHLVMYYLSQITEEQTLVMYSGHPLGLFPSHKDAPRVVISNGMVIPNYSSKGDYDRMNALGVTMYGQMTAGSYCYIGPQGIVHGTTITVLNAGRKYLGTSDLTGKVYLTSGLGGMSGAQAKAATICGAIGVVAEIDRKALEKRHEQGWVVEKTETVAECIAAIKKARADKISTSIAYLGNVVDLWEALVLEEENIVELASDQTSCHNVYNGGYYPVQLSIEEANEVMTNDPARFKQLVQESLRRQIAAINTLSQRGMKFWDYGNSFLLECQRAGADVMNAEGDGFRYPSYVQDIMGDIFSLGFGPFRWVCTSGLEQDLITTDQIAAQILQDLGKIAPVLSQQQYADNYKWIVQAHENKLVVGSQARILYADTNGRVAIALAINEAIASGKISAPVVLSRDHHDVSGTDSPYRETSNVYDGSSFCADMATQNFVGDAMRGATWVALHNGGGVGFGEAVNGGFGLVLDGGEDAARRAKLMLGWDVYNGISRRAWSRNSNAIEAVKEAMKSDPLLQVTLPNLADSQLLDSLF